MALNFSTDEHYGFDGTKCPEEYQTAQRRLYPRTVSCWSTLVSKELPAWALLRSYKRRFYRDLVSAKPATSFDITAFLLFRIFDIWKPFPVSWLDSHLHGGIGIMLDDVMAGIYALLVLQVGLFVVRLF